MNVSRLFIWFRGHFTFPLVNTPLKASSNLTKSCLYSGYCGARPPIVCHSDTCEAQGRDVTYSRQFVQNEVSHLDAESIEAYQNNRFLGFGRKTQFSLDIASGTAILSGKNGEEFSFGNGISAPSEKKGKYYIEFSGCR